MKKLSRKYKMALACCILMMAIAFLVYYNVSRSEKENPVALQQICMVSAQTGWALTSDNELLYTDNGIDEFCTVKKLQATENYAHLCVMNGTTVYLAYFSEENIVVEYSLDMGAEWKTTRIPYREYGDANTVFINFADEQNGYLLYCSTPGAGQMTKILFQTTDGGESFEKISDLSDVISGYPTGLAYSTSSCGYISTTYHGEDKYLFYTADSGVTWRSIELEEYEIENFSYVEAYPPVFFGEANREGKIILKYVGAEKNSYVEYITEDGGATWEKGNLLDCDNIANYSYFGEGGYWINAEGVPKELEIVQATETDRESDTESDLINTGENTGNEILRRLMTADLSSAEEATITGDWDSVVRLAELPEYDITMYGYNDEEISGRGVAIQIGDDVNYFDWVYIAPRCILPEMYWDDEKKQLQVALNIYTGTGVGAQELHLLQQYETGSLSDSVLDIRNYSELLAERLEYAYDKETNSLTILDKRDGGKLFQTTLPYADGEAVVGICAGDISNFILGDELWLEFTPGYCLEGRVSIEYEGMVPLKAQILLESIEENRFTLGKMYNAQFAEFF